ncbi:hypothetical protein ES288_D11G289100v1 [Gossypium darwinii]|uniref:Uncharacterized protein n=1 Tax=Gossypium darwinii TaxID=34276 RepID=A0A5D2ARZ1_GOSDA|nr:hypothetical protein ES288_D11G289100v1 [Gossypium darwinii]
MCNVTKFITSIYIFNLCLLPKNVLSSGSLELNLYPFFFTFSLSKFFALVLCSSSVGGRTQKLGRRNRRWHRRTGIHVLLIANDEYFAG